MGVSTPSQEVCKHELSHPLKEKVKRDLSPETLIAGGSGVEELGWVTSLGVMKGLVGQVRGRREARESGKPGAHGPRG